MISAPADLLTVLRAASRILIAAHLRPDGDAVGSTLGMGWLLKLMGKEVMLYNGSGFPDDYAWLRYPAPLYTTIEELPQLPDLVIALDSGDTKRLGEDLLPLLATIPSINIDHHLGNPQYGSAANWVDPERAATGEMVALVAQALQIPLAGDMAEALYTAIVTDTGAFAYANTSAQTMQVCAHMMENGLDVPRIRDYINKTWTPARMRLWVEALSRAKLLDEDRLAVTVVTQEMLEQHQADAGATEGIVEQLRRIRSVRVALFLMETSTGCKASLRSSGSDNVQQVAAAFGGGGHRNAAGATFTCSPETALQSMLPLLRALWNTH